MKSSAGAADAKHVDWLMHIHHWGLETLHETEFVFDLCAINYIPLQIYLPNQLQQIYVSISSTILQERWQKSQQRI